MPRTKGHQTKGKREKGHPEKSPLELTGKPFNIIGVSLKIMASLKSHGG